MANPMDSLVKLVALKKKVLKSPLLNVKYTA